MILVKHIEAFEVEGPVGEIAHFEDRPCDYSTQPVFELERELVRGRTFIRPDGTTICIGTSKQAQEVLGIQYEAWETMKDELGASRVLLYDLRNLSAWGHLKLFLKKMLHPSP